MKKVSVILTIMSAIYDSIRDAISESKKSRYRLWQETGISQAQLCEFLHGRRGMKVEHLETLAEALGLEIVIRRRKYAKKKEQ